MSNNWSIFNGLLVLALAAAVAVGQDTTATAKKVVVNPDGSYSVIEYPVGKEVIVNLVPGASVAGKGTVHVMRTADGSHVVLDMAGVPAESTS